MRPSRRVALRPSRLADPAKNRCPSPVIVYVHRYQPASTVKRAIPCTPTAGLPRLAFRYRDDIAGDGVRTQGVPPVGFPAGQRLATARWCRPSVRSPYRRGPTVRCMTLTLEIVAESNRRGEHVFPDYEEEARFNRTWWQREGSCVLLSHLGQG